MRQKQSSAAPSRFASCDWYYQVPLKHNEKKGEVVLPPTSQIPGLSDLAEPHDDLMSAGRKTWIKDTDSAYVKLSKQGGQADLLKHTTSAPKKTLPVSYAPPDWYTDENSSPPPEQAAAPLRNVPDYMIHEELNMEQSEQTYETRKGPFDFDQKTVWQRETEDNEKENHHDKKVKLPAIKHDSNVTASGKGPLPPKTRHDKPGKKCFFPPMPGNKNDAVNFSKLLSNGYGDDWHRHMDEQEKKAPQKSKAFKG
ncbi:PREDICTED: uncharacterized protein C7orf57 homolog [Nanorana parkeri]|uniref:uncharacterized protein C7orf57 homolog n=1 Tax=Nanorana parkeri TaxID=125878 RepID=UPI00085475D1|nr:PREDICTED: uncharacterized protein C7orf57 homolog [Nanorana parkeri]